MSTPLISVVVPVYNTEKYLSECIESILSQNLKDFELILVNDESTDNSLDICKKYSNKDKRIHIIDQKNQGVTAARNHGVNASKGKYIVFIDSDDTIPDYCLFTLMSYADDNVDIVIGALWNHDNKQKLLSVDEYREKCIMGRIFPGPVGKLFKKELFTVNTFDIPREIHIGEDMLMNVRISFNCKNPILLLPDVIYNYRQHDESTSAKFQTTWEYEGLFYKQMFSSLPQNLEEQFGPVMLNKAIEVWHDFYGYKYHLPHDYKQSEFYILLNEQFNKFKPEINHIDRKLLSVSNPIVRFLLVNHKRIGHLFK